MIRFLLLIILPLAAPFVAWYLWRVFGKPPTIDPVTGDQIPPDIEKAPIKALVLTALGLLALTVGGFLLAHDRFSDDPYIPIGIIEFERTTPRETDTR